MRIGTDLRVLRTLAIMWVAADAIAIVVIVIGWIAGSNRALIGVGFLIGGLGTLASLVGRMILLSPSLRPATRGQRAESPIHAAHVPGIVVRAAASLVMLWVGTSLLIARH